MKRIDIIAGEVIIFSNVIPEQCADNITEQWKRVDVI